MKPQFIYKPFNLPNILAGTFRKKNTISNIAEYLKIGVQEIVQAEQVHGGMIGIASARDLGRTLPHVDALITNLEHVPLLIRTADCLPIFIYAKTERAIALVHAGRKGTELGIVPKTIGALHKEYGSKPEDCLVSIGPGIGVCCYEIEPVTHAHYDLIEVNQQQLKNVGIPDKNIHTSGICTCCEKDQCFSYRREGAGTGRMYSVLMLK